jgi:hypothetical protein
MDNEPRKTKSKEIGEPTVEKIKPSNTIFFLDGFLVRLVHSNRASNICEIYNFNQDKMQTMLYSDFKKHRKRAFSTKNTVKIFKRSRVQLERWIKAGLVNPPTGATAGGKRIFQKLSYYSEDDLFTIRSVAATIHKGRPRKDGRTTPSRDIPTEKELRSLIGDAIMLYTKTEDGRFIPVWQEETW